MDRLYIIAGFLWLVAGMIFGIYLGITDQLQFANSHAHANLLGFVISVLFGLLYRNWPALLSSRLAWPQFAVFQAGALVLVAGKFDIDSGGGGGAGAAGIHSGGAGHAADVLDVRHAGDRNRNSQEKRALMSTRVQDHYGSADIVERILGAVPWAATHRKPLAAEQLFPFDQLHGRELLATRDHAEKLNPAGNAHLLDVGSGIGGPARYFARVFGCRVTGIDLTAQFVAAASELTRLTGLAEKADFVEADAAAMPFEAGTFDHAYCFYVGMNLPDKPAVLLECFRVLKPGATLLWTEVTTNVGQPQYPLPWARDAAGHVAYP